RPARVRAGAGARRRLGRRRRRLHGDARRPGQRSVGRPEHGAAEPVRGSGRRTDRIRRPGHQAGSQGADVPAGARARLEGRLRRRSDAGSLCLWRGQPHLARGADPRPARAPHRGHARRRGQRRPQRRGSGRSGPSGRRCGRGCGGRRTGRTDRRRGPDRG
ncbi:hypothetical protein LTR94_031839, partial [Friedmanniomyces endolithicus]